MKKIIYVALCFMFCSFSMQTQAQGDPEPYAMEVIEAYKNKDLPLLQKHATAILYQALNEGFFESSDAKPLVEMAKTWDGSIKDIRYDEMHMMGQTALIAMVYFGDNPNGNLNVVTLSSLAESDWKAFGMGLMDVSEEEFTTLSTEIPADKPKAEPKQAEADVDEADVEYHGFTVEMATGETYDNPTINELKAYLESIDDDNFFLSLSSKDGFIQTTISEEGFIVQYNDGDGLFEAEPYFDFEEVVEIFVAFMKDEDWKAMTNWIRM